MQFTYKGFLRGFRLTLPAALGVFAYGLVFGMLAAQRGLSNIQALLMSLTVFAGASQLIAMDLWTYPLPMATIIITTFIVNSRHLLMGAALQPYLKTLDRFKTYGSLFFCADENWAVSVKEFRKGNKEGAILFGGGFAVYAAWSIATMIGYSGVAVVQQPAQYGFDFAFTAVFTALLVGMWNGKQDAFPWAMAALAAIGAKYLLPGKWYILIGALVASTLEALRDERRS